MAGAAIPPGPREGDQCEAGHRGGAMLWLEPRGQGGPGPRGCALIPLWGQRCGGKNHGRTFSIGAPLRLPPVWPSRVCFRVPGHWHLPSGEHVLILCKSLPSSGAEGCWGSRTELPAAAAPGSCSEDPTCRFLKACGSLGAGLCCPGWSSHTGHCVKCVH